MQEYFLAEEKRGCVLSFSLLISFHSWRQFTTIYPQASFSFYTFIIPSRSFISSVYPHAFPPILTHSLSSSISVSAWWVSSSGPPLSLSLLPSVLYLFAFAIIFVLEIKWSYFSAQPHTCRLCHVPAEEFTSHLLPHSRLSSTVPSFCSPPTASIVSCAPRVFIQLNASLRYSNKSRITGCSIHRFTLVCNNLWAGSGVTIVMFHASCRFMVVASEASSSTNSLLTLSNLISDDKKIKIHLNIFQWLIAFGTLVQLIYFIRGLKPEQCVISNPPHALLGMQCLF